MYRPQYGVEGYHANCHDNLCAAIRELGLDPAPWPNAFNFFMNVNIGADGKMSFSPPPSRAGDYFEVRAKMDLAIALSASPTATCNGGAPPRPLAYEVQRLA